MGWKNALWAEWQIEYEIGSGAFGRVYKIRRQDIGGTYYAALKVISFPQNPEEINILKKKRKMTDQQIVDYYQRMAAEVASEFAVMERLKGHTNVVSYEDHKIVPHSDGIGWDVLIRMELLRSLPDYLRKHPMNERDVCRLGMDICNALILCEKHGIIHRDIKPENIFVSEYGDFELGDFSLAKHTSLGSKSHSPQGTYSYMAPEVYKGFEYNATIDQYSLGLILYRLLNNGRGPFQPPPPTPLTHEIKDVANQKRLHSQTFPKPVYASGLMNSIIQKACAYHPAARFADAAALQKALKRCSSLQVALEPKKQGEYYIKKAAEMLQQRDGPEEEIRPGRVEIPGVAETEIPATISDTIQTVSISTSIETASFTGTDSKAASSEKEKLQKNSRKAGKEYGKDVMNAYFYHAGDL